MTVKEILKDVYKHPTGSQQVTNEYDGGLKYWADEIVAKDGIFVYINGMEYPEKGMGSVEDIWNINIVKRILIESAKSTKYLAWIAILPWSMKMKMLNKLLKSFNTIGMKVMSPTLLLDNHLTPMSQEVRRVLGKFLFALGFDTAEAEPFAEIFANILSFDNAYRYRLQDLFNETSRERLCNPRKEIKRLILLNRDREVMEYDLVKASSGEEIEHYKKRMLAAGHEIEGNVLYARHAVVSNKFKVFAMILSWSMIHPRVKWAFRKAIDDISLTKLRPDEGDHFWMCVRPMYHYFGLKHKDRLKLINHLKVVKPSKL